jgi:hypothetical protein
MVNPFSSGASGFINESLAMLANLTGGWDGLVLRANTPFLNTNGTNFTSSKGADK